MFVSVAPLGRKPLGASDLSSSRRRRGPCRLHVWLGQAHSNLPHLLTLKQLPLSADADLREAGIVQV